MSGRENRSLRDEDGAAELAVVWVVRRGSRHDDDGHTRDGAADGDPALRRRRTVQGEEQQDDSEEPGPGGPARPISKHTSEIALNPGPSGRP